jgi:hypothetical protein
MVGLDMDSVQRRGVGTGELVQVGNKSMRYNRVIEQWGIVGPLITVYPCSPSRWYWWGWY